MNKKAEAQGIPGETVLRISFTAIILIFLIWWGIGRLISFTKPLPAESLNALIDAGSNAKDNEPFVRVINLGDAWLYGFNSGENQLQLEKEAVKKPDTPSCRAGACLCMCDKECKSKEKTYCKNIEGIDRFLSTSSFAGANEGAKQGEAYSVAINGDKAKVTCIKGERSQKTLTISTCTET